MKRNELFYKAKLIIIGMRGGLMVERRTPERDVGVRSSLRSPCCILEQDTITSQKEW